jgi:hypothetical protein
MAWPISFGLFLNEAQTFHQHVLLIAEAWIDETSGLFQDTRLAQVGALLVWTPANPLCPRCGTALLEVSVPKCLTFLSNRLKKLA